MGDRVHHQFYYFLIVFILYLDLESSGYECPLDVYASGSYVATVGGCTLFGQCFANQYQSITLPLAWAGVGLTSGGSCASACTPATSYLSYAVPNVHVTCLSPQYSAFSYVDTSSKTVIVICGESNTAQFRNGFPGLTGAEYQFVPTNSGVCAQLKSVLPSCA